MNKELEEILQHFGTKGMKWGVRKKKDELNSQERSIKKGTSIQNISSRELDMGKGRHMYGSYTDYDKGAYVDMMGNFMYNGKGYKNEFVVKKDIKLPSDKQLVDNFVELVKKNPKQVSKDMSAAYNDTHIFFEKNAKHFEKKISKIQDSDSKRGEKLAKQYISVMVSDKAAKSRADFMGSLIKKGFDGMSDVNDRDTNSGTQDPLIIFKPNKTLGKVKTVKLEKEELDFYYKKHLFEQETKKERYDLKNVQHNQEVKGMKPELQDILQHHGVKGMKWGKHKANASAGVKKVGEKTKEVASKVASKAKPHIDSIKRENSWKKQLNNAKNMSTKQIQKVASRAQLENDLKRLSKKPDIGSAKDKKDYLKRADMSDQELTRKVQRLRAKDNLNRTANEATKKQKEIAKKVMQIAAPLVITAALNGGKVGKKEIFNTVMNPGGAKAKAIKAIVDAASKAKHGEDLTDVLLHTLDDDAMLQIIEEEDTLQHFGVKGMHWGVRKKVNKMVKEHRQKQNKKVLESHDKLIKKNKTYKKLYARNKNRYKTHLGAAQKSHQQLRQIHKQRTHLAISAALMAAPHLAPHIANAANAASKAAQNPDNIRKAKNVAQAIKRSPIRYVDGKKMKNVIN